MSSVSHIDTGEVALRIRTAVNEASEAGVQPCPLCNSRQSDVAFRDNKCLLRACRSCELFFVDPYPSIVQGHIRVSSNVHDDIQILDCASRYRGERFYYDRHFDSIARECEGATSILDVGCGTGHLLERLSQRGDLYRAGIELNPRAAAFARRISGCEVFETPLEEFRTNREFDVIAMINVFSHVPSFDGMFASLLAALRPGGKLILRTSEMGSNVSRWNQAHWGIPDDLHFMGLRTLHFICAKYGFAVVRHERTPFENELFRRSRWQQMGRSRGLNSVKRAALMLPGFFRIARHAYAATLGKRLFVSLIVLKPTRKGRLE